MTEFTRGWKVSTSFERFNIGYSYLCAIGGTAMIGYGSKIEAVNTPEAIALTAVGIGIIAGSVAWLREITENVINRERQTIR